MPRLVQIIENMLANNWSVSAIQEELERDGYTSREISTAMAEAGLL